MHHNCLSKILALFSFFKFYIVILNTMNNKFNLFQSTVSSPPNFWKNTCSSNSTTNQQCLPFSSGLSSQSSRNGMPFVISGGSGFSSNNQSTFGSRTSYTQQSKDSFLKPDRFSMNSNYENDCLMQMD